MVGSAQTELQKGIKYYNMRGENSVGVCADSTNVNLAVECFNKAIDNITTQEKAAEYLLMTYYFKGSFVNMDNEERKAIFDKGKNLGEEMVEKYPNSPGILHWYIANLAKWANAYGKMAAAKEGIADKLKDYSELLIKLDPTYRNGGGYRILGAIHYEAPYIPFFLTWPSNDDALKFLTLAKGIDPTDSNTNLYLAKALYKAGQKEKAREELKLIISTPPRKEELVEDRYNIMKAHEYLERFK